MNAPELIDNVCTDFLNVGGTDAANAATRARVLRAAQTAVVDLSGRWNWSWKSKTAEVLIEAGEYQGDLPANFQSFGKDGIAVITDPLLYGREMYWIPGKRIEGLILSQPLAAPIEVYSNIRQFTSGIQVLRVYPTPSVNTTITVCYNAKCPVLVDSVTAVTSGLEEIPEDWHEVVREMTVRILMKGEADLRAGGEQRIDVEAFIAEMIRAERAGQEQALEIPRYGGGW